MAGMNADIPKLSDSLPTLEKIRAWQQEGTELRKTLLDERKMLAARLAEIDEALAAMPAGDGELPLPTPALPVSRPIVVPKKASAAAIVLAVLDGHPAGLSASQVIEEVHRIKATIKKAYIHAVLFRFRSSGVATASGTKGAMIYQIARKKEATRNE
jgi:hypothetical protein